MLETKVDQETSVEHSLVALREKKHMATTKMAANGGGTSSRPIWIHREWFILRFLPCFFLYRGT